MYDFLSTGNMSEWSVKLESQLQDYIKSCNHGDYRIWMDAVKSLPDITPTRSILDERVVSIGTVADTDDESRKFIRTQLQRLMPWRKGPFSWFGVDVDAEWRSDVKWSRIAGEITSLKNRNVFDIGCGNGYYGWRMLGDQARMVVGIDPTLRFVMQFQAAKKYLEDKPLFVLPFALEEMDTGTLAFDTVFSMGVIYHRKDPRDHLERIFHCLRSGGELVLESLIVDGSYSDILLPKGRYAKMNNVWNIPSCRILEDWLLDSGFINPRTINVTTTTREEQRTTEWMLFESLTDFLDKSEPGKTVEGYPAPKRAILLAEKP